MARECAPSEKATPRGARRGGGASGKIPAATYSPTRKPCSTIGSGGLNFRVRDGNGWDPSDIATGNLGSALRWRSWAEPAYAQESRTCDGRKRPSSTLASAELLPRRDREEE